MNIHFVLGDQLNLEVSSLTDFDLNKDIIFMCEVWDEATYVKHHKKKIIFIFSAMRHFAHELRELGYQVQYTKIDDQENTHSFTAELERAIKLYQPEKVVLTEPSEYRVLKNFKDHEFNVPIEIRQDDRFLSTHNEFKEWANGRKQLRMEYFYREMRKKYNILIDNGKPTGGQWNYDHENRKPAKDGMSIPKTFSIEPDSITLEVMDLVSEKFSNHFGNMEPFHFAVTRKQALLALNQFIEKRLINFGDYQDAMIEGEPWMYHSHISFYLNCGLLFPLECLKAVEDAYQKGQVPLNAAEGFIRQIIGWREYVRGIYWLKMPEYEFENFFDASGKLPPLFWGGETKMNCLHQCVKETKENAYAHHIQRLMILGNFALIAGLSPKEINEWYLIVYADAYHWVELPNVTGMILFGDGGLLASKPYASSGAYINKMSDYCNKCHYKVSQKNGLDACPFNYLYWDFLSRNQDKLKKNNRLGFVYKNLERMDEEKIETIKKDSRRFLKSLENGEEV
jgi:deoxyribodipyrimidine photolyase-related protein